MPQQESPIQEGVMTLNQLLNMAWGWKTKSQDELEERLRGSNSDEIISNRLPCVWKQNSR